MSDRSRLWILQFLTSTSEQVLFAHSRAKQVCFAHSCATQVHFAHFHEQATAHACDIQGRLLAQASKFALHTHTQNKVTLLTSAGLLAPVSVFVSYTINY